MVENINQDKRSLVILITYDSSDFQYNDQFYVFNICQKSKN